MEKESSNQIAPLVNTCLKEFRELIAALEDESNYKDSLVDTLGRFRIWAGNVSAHRTGRRSLQFRLRDSSELADSVVRYVGDIISLIGELRTGDATLPACADSDDEDDLLFGPAPEPQIHHHEAVLKELNGVITCLLQLSMTLMNPARNDQIRYANVFDTSHFDPVAIEHVRMKLPDAPDYLVERLGKAISRNYHYFRYREEHHLKLAEGIDGPDEDGLQSTVATSVKQDHRTELVLHESDTESVYSATSYAPTMSREPTLRPPERPAQGQDGSPFECPLCHQIITALDERSWQQHFYEDLPPYVCFEAGCQTANRQYSRRREWQRHWKKHMLVWICPYGCSETMESEADFSTHISAQHDHNMEKAILKRLAQSCSRMRDDRLQWVKKPREPSSKETSHECDAVGESGEPISLRKCPLCPSQKNSKIGWLKHIGHHMEEVALFAVPRYLMTEADGEDSDEGSADPERSEHSFNSDGNEGVAADTEGTGDVYDDELKHGRVSHTTDQGEQMEWGSKGESSMRPRQTLMKRGSISPTVLGQIRDQAAETIFLEAAQDALAIQNDNRRLRRISAEAEENAFKESIVHRMREQEEQKERNANELLKKVALQVDEREATMTREELEAEEVKAHGDMLRHLRDLGLTGSSVEAMADIDRAESLRTQAELKSNPLEVRSESSKPATGGLEFEMRRHNNKMVQDAEERNEQSASVSLNGPHDNWDIDNDESLSVEDNILERSGSPQYFNFPEVPGEYFRNPQLQHVRANYASHRGSVQATPEETEKVSQANIHQYPHDAQSITRPTENALGEIEEGKDSKAGLGADALDLGRATDPPVYPRINRKYLSNEALNYYDLPWRYDQVSTPLPEPVGTALLHAEDLKVVTFADSLQNRPILTLLSSCAACRATNWMLCSSVRRVRKVSLY